MEVRWHEWDQQPVLDGHGQTARVSPFGIETRGPMAGYLFSASQGHHSRVSRESDRPDLSRLTMVNLGLDGVYERR